MNDPSESPTIDIVNFFLAAISYVDNASERLDNPKGCSIACAKAIYSIRAAFQRDYGVTHFPSAWKIAHKLEVQEPDTLMYLGHPDIEKYVEKFWLSVADGIEKL